MLASMCRSLRAARAATFAYFAVNGFVMGNLAVADRLADARPVPAATPPRKTPDRLPR